MSSESSNPSSSSSPTKDVSDNHDYHYVWMTPGGDFIVELVDPTDITVIVERVVFSKYFVGELSYRIQGQKDLENLSTTEIVSRLNISTAITQWLFNLSENEVKRAIHMLLDSHLLEWGGYSDSSSIERAVHMSSDSKLLHLKNSSSSSVFDHDRNDIDFHSATSKRASEYFELFIKEGIRSIRVKDVQRTVNLALEISKDYSFHKQTGLRTTFPKKRVPLKIYRMKSAYSLDEQQQEQVDELSKQADKLLDNYKLIKDRVEEHNKRVATMDPEGNITFRTNDANVEQNERLERAKMKQREIYKRFEGYRAFDKDADNGGTSK